MPIFAIKSNFNHFKGVLQGLSKVTYQDTGIISIIYRYVSFETPCIYQYCLTNLAQKYHEQISEVESSSTSLASRTSLRTHFEVLGLKPSKIGLFSA